MRASDLQAIFTITALFLCAAANTSHADEWVELFDGKSLDGWTKTGGDGVFEVKGAAIVGSGAKKTTFLSTEKDYGDFELVFEVKLHNTDLNSGVQIRSHPFPSAERFNTLKGPQVELQKSPGRSGCIFQQGGGRWITPEEKLVRNPHLKNGEWNLIRVVVDGPKIRTWINGKPVTDLVDDEAYKTFPHGRIGLQIHGVKDYDETPRKVSWRNIRIREKAAASK